METAFTKLASIRYPVMQAPIGSAAGPRLASAVSNAGGLGSLTLWTEPLDRVTPLVAETRVSTDQPFSVNIRADADKLGHAAAAIDAGARIVHLFWEDPAPFASVIHGAGAKMFCTVANTDDAKRALDAGADALIAQGWESGGHVRGTISTLALVPTVVDVAGDVPVVAAGAIVDGRGLAAVLTLGASGAMMGTRFVASEESLAHPDYKRALVSARQIDAIWFPNLFDQGWPNAPHRALRNSTVRAWERAGSPASGSRPGQGEPVATAASGRPIPRYAASLPLATMTGDVEALALYAGQGVEQVRDVLPAARIVEATVREAEHRLAHWEAPR